MESHKDFIASYTKLPIYLSELLETDKEVILVHSKKKSEDLDISLSETLNISSNGSTINLTGTPLEVDLNVLPAVYDTSKKWNRVETQYRPIKLKLAKKLINDYNKERVTQNKAVYCICDGTDEKQIVILGSSQFDRIFTRTLVFERGCVDETYPQNNINSMMDVHIENVGVVAPKIETKVTCLYELYGLQLTSNHILEDVESTGSVLLKSSWNTSEYNIPQYGASIKMMLQAVVGHENSILHNFFEEFKFIHNCIKMLSKRQNLDELVISSNSLDVTELYKKITDILCEVNVVRKPTMALNNMHDAIHNISQISLTDKLWSLFKSCETVNDLKFCFNYLFEAINDGSSRLHILEDDKNIMIGKMIADVYAGRMIVPNLSSKQSLELFIELGLQKMKRNYFSIIKSCDFAIGEQLLDKWNKVGFSLCETRRGTFAELNVSQSLAQLCFLLRIHVLLEFLQLVEENCAFSKDISLSVLKHACSKYITENLVADVLLNVETKQLCDLTVPLTFFDNKLLQDRSPAKWQIKMTSTQKNSSVTTIFCYSNTPLFPDSIYSYEDANESTGIDEGKFYVTQLETYSDKIC